MSNRRKQPTGQQVVSALRERIVTFDETGSGHIERWIDDYYSNPYAHAECIVDSVGSAMWRLVSAGRNRLRLSYRGFNEARQELAVEFNREIFRGDK